MGKKNKEPAIAPKNQVSERAEELYEKNKTRGRRPFKTRDSVGERPVSLQEQRKKKRDSE